MNEYFFQQGENGSSDNKSMIQNISVKIYAFVSQKILQKDLTNIKQHSFQHW